MRSSSVFRAALMGGSLCALLCAMPATLRAQSVVNGIVTVPRVFNDYPGSTLTLTPPVSETVPSNGFGGGALSIDDRNMVKVPQGGANRDDFRLSSNGGASIQTFNITTGYEISADVVLTAGSNSPRKEAGLRCNSNVSGDALFIINSDAGEVVAFGAGAPFYNFKNHGMPGGYVAGNEIFMQEQYVPLVGTYSDGTGIPSNGHSNAGPQNEGTMQYWAQDITNGGALLTSGPLMYSNNEGGPTDFQVAYYGQFQSAGANDFGNVVFDNLDHNEVPEPASLALVSLGGLGLMARRRAKSSV